MQKEKSVYSPISRWKGAFDSTRPTYIQRSRSRTTLNSTMRPNLYVVAGPNGAGKRIIFSTLVKTDFGVFVYDELSRNLIRKDL